jgi:hypothetical protein
MTITLAQPLPEQCLRAVCQVPLTFLDLMEKLS